jgi:hypothetical protein
MQLFELDIKFFEERPDLNIIHVYDKTFLESYIDSMELLINYFNQEYNWDGLI